MDSAEPDPPVLQSVGGSLGPPADLVAQISRWLAERRADDAVAERTRERWLHQQAQEDGSFAGVLLDLGERDCTVVMQGVGGRHHRGVVKAVAGNFAVLGTEQSLDLLLPFSGIVSVRQEPGTSATVGDRTVVLDTTLGEVLVGLAGERPHVVLVTLDGSGIAGQLRAAGRDVLTVRLDGEDRSTVYVPLAGVAEVGLIER